MLECNRSNICISTGSACSAGYHGPSETMKALRKTEQELCNLSASLLAGIQQLNSWNSYYIRLQCFGNKRKENLILTEELKLMGANRRDQLLLWLKESKSPLTGGELAKKRTSQDRLLYRIYRS